MTRKRRTQRLRRVDSEPLSQVAGPGKALYGEPPHDLDRLNPKCLGLFPALAGTVWYFQIFLLH